MTPEGYAVNWTAVALAFVVGVAAMGAMLAASALLSPRRPSEAKAIAYESGIPPTPAELDAVQRPLLHLRHPLPDLRRGGRVPLPLGAGFRGRRDSGLRFLRDDAVHRRAAARRGLRMAKGGAALEIERRAEAPLFRPSSWERPEKGRFFDSPEGGAVSSGKGNRPAANLIKGAAPGVVTAKLDELAALGRSNSLWTLTFGLACCAIEMISTHMAHHDLDRFGVVTWPSPRQSRRDDRRGDGGEEDGGADQIALRADARPEVGDRNGNLRDERAGRTTAPTAS